MPGYGWLYTLCFALVDYTHYAWLWLVIHIMPGYGWLYSSYLAMVDYTHHTWLLLIILVTAGYGWLHSSWLATVDYNNHAWLWSIMLITPGYGWLYTCLAMFIAERSKPFKNWKNPTSTWLQVYHMHTKISKARPKVFGQENRYTYFLSTPRFIRNHR